MIRLEALIRNGTKFTLQSIYLNPSFVVSVREHELLTKDLRCEKMGKKFPQGLRAEHTLSEVVYSEGGTAVSLVVVGSPEMIQSKLFGSNTRSLLRG